MRPSPSALMGWLSARLDRARRERGAASSEWVVVAAVLVVVAAVLAVIIYNLVADPGNSVEPPAPPGGL